MADSLQQLAVDLAAAIPLTEQLREQLLWLIATEVLRPGDRLPSLRTMAEHLGINVNTVRSAYLRLEADGLVTIRQGDATRVLPLDLNRLMRSASTVRSRTIGIIVPVLENPFYHALIRGINEIAFPDVLQFMSSAGDNVRIIPRLLAQFIGKRVDGIIVASFDAPAFLQAVNGRHPMPLVTVDWPGAEGCSVALDYDGAGYQATRHLIEHGHRRVGLIRFGMDIPIVTSVCDGWSRALAEAGIRPDPDWIANVPAFDIDAGAEGMRELLARPNRPSAVFAIADMLALGALRELRASGLRVPEDIALTSFNDIPAAALVDPPLTTVVAPAQAMGREAMQILNDLIAGRTPAQQEIVFPTSLVIRQSCGCHPQPGL